MDLPKCKTCGERHRLGGCPSFSGVGRAERLQKVISSATEPKSLLSGKKIGSGTGASGVAGSTPANSTKVPFKRPLAKDADKTISRQEPWKAEGMSRASWYRRQKEKKS